MGKCFEVTVASNGMVRISSDYQDVADDEGVNWVMDEMEAWTQFRDEIKAGKWDHIGEG